MIWLVKLLFLLLAVPTYAAALASMRRLTETDNALMAGLWLLVTTGLIVAASILLISVFAVVELPGIT